MSSDKNFKHLENLQLRRAANSGINYRDLTVPKEGWVRTFRRALGMTTYQLADRVGVPQPRIVELERAEKKGATTLRTLEQVAQALNCRLEYVFIPEKTVEDTLKDKALKVAKWKVGQVSHSMDLEQQGLSESERQRHLENMVEELMLKPKKIWENDV